MVSANETGSYRIVRGVSGVIQVVVGRNVGIICEKA